MTLLEAGEYRVHPESTSARAVDAASGEALADSKADGLLDNVFDLQDRVVAQLAETIGTSSTVSRRPHRETSSLEAYQAFTEARLKLETLDAKKVAGKKTAKQGAGDQGLMFGYASNETPELMPAPIMFAHRLGRELTRVRKSGRVPWLRPDAKSQVSVIYENGKPVGISCVVVSTQHSQDVKHSEIRSFVIEEIIRKVLPKEMLNDDTKFCTPPVLCRRSPQAIPITAEYNCSSYGGMGRHGWRCVLGKKIRASRIAVPLYVPGSPRTWWQRLALKCEIHSPRHRSS